MKITRDKALAVTAFCRRHGLKYVGAGAYPNTVKAAMKSDLRAPNGMKLHVPRDTVDLHNQYVQSSTRVYVLWYGEPVSAIEEACAFIRMTSTDKEIYVVRCNGNISQAAVEAEICQE